MDNDERDPRDWPETPEETPGEEPGWGVPTPDGEATEPVRQDAASDVPDDVTADASPAEIESWPSHDAGPAEVETRPWPTEPPAAGSASGWPTEPPERGDAPILEPEPETPAADATWGSAPELSEPMETPVPASDSWSSPVQPEPETVPAATDAYAEPEPMTPPPGEVEAYPATSETDASAAPLAAGAMAAQTVPDAESVAGESTQCPRCGTENRPGLAFCRNCGQRLVAAGVSTTVERPGAPEGTMACPRCGTHNRAGVAFCQNCGANLRGAAPGYVPPAAEDEVLVEPVRRGAVLGPVVLLVGLVGLITGYLLPFAYGGDSLFDRAMGSGGYGLAFWNGYDAVGTSLVDQAYFGLAAPIPIFGLLLVILAVAGFARAAPGPVQMAGLVVALLWAIGLVVAFLLVEVAGSWGGDIVGLLRDLSPAGIIFFLASLIVVIGVLTRMGRS